MFHPPLIASYSELVSVQGEKTLLPVGVDDQGNVYVNVVNDPLPVNGTSAFIPLAVSAIAAAGGAATLTLPSAAGKTTYLRGFTLSGRSVGTLVTVQVTITGPLATLTYFFTMDKTGQAVIRDYYGEQGIAAAAPSTPIVLTYPAVAGTAQVGLVMWGYQI